MEDVAALAVQDCRLRDVEVRACLKRNPGFDARLNCPDEKTGGVGVIIRTSLVEFLDNDGDDGVAVEDDAGRLLVVRLRHREGPSIQVGNVYMPWQPDKWVRLCDAVLGAGLGERQRADILLGDWNYSDQALDRTSGRPSPGVMKERMPKLLTELGGPHMGLCDVWRRRNPEVIAFTHDNPAGGKSRGDRIYMSHRLERVTTGVDTRAPPAWTDHWAVAAELCVPGEKRGPGRWRLNPRLLRQPAVKAFLAGGPKVGVPWGVPQEAQGGEPDAVGSQGENRTGCRTGGRERGSGPMDPERFRQLTEEGAGSWTAAKKGIAAALKTVGMVAKRKRFSERRRVRLRRNALMQKRRRGERNEALGRTIASLEGKERALSEMATQEYAYNAMAKNALLGEKATKWFFESTRERNQTTIPGLRDSEGHVVRDPAGMLEIGQKFYEELYRVKGSERRAAEEVLGAWSNKISAAASRDLDAPITVEEVEHAIAKGERGKSPGPDGLPVEFYKFLAGCSKERQGVTVRHSLLEELTGLFNSILEGHRPPPGWTDGCLSILYKNKGSPDDLRFYRPLTVMNVEYKLFTGVLARRLTAAVAPIIGSHQNAFIPGRLIDDSVRCVQLMIDAHKGEKNGGSYVAFLDQEKAYDRVSHEFLWRTMEHVGLPAKFRQCVQTLYEDARVRLTINGFQGEPMKVESGVRQGDPLSCILYVLVIESLARRLIAAPELKGFSYGGLERLLVCLLFADDTAVSIRNQGEADVLRRILGVFEKASGQRVNWDKSLLLKLGNPPEVRIPGASVLGHKEVVTYLGIPVGVEISEGISQRWEGMVEAMRKKARRWLAAHLSLRGRVLVANSVVLAMPRYLLKFLRLPGARLQQMESIYWGLVWDDKDYGLVRRERALCAKDRGGLGCFDIQSICKAEAISLFKRAESRPDLPWASLLRELCVSARSRSVGTIREVVDRPWFQVVAARAPPRPESFRHHFEIWKRMVGRALKDDRGPLWLPRPIGQDFRKVAFWYHPALRVTAGQGAKRFHCRAFRELLRDARVVGDLVAPDQTIKIPPGLRPEEEEQVRTAVESLLSDFPESWGAPSNGEKTSGKGELLLRRQGIPVRKATFRAAYWECHQDRVGDMPRVRMIAPVREAFKRMSGKQCSEREVWKSARDQLQARKAGDLLWRLLHDRVRVGADYENIPVEDRWQWTCPWDGDTLDKEHLWLGCGCSAAVWRTMRRILRRMGSRVVVTPGSMAELIALLVQSFETSDCGRERWHTLYGLAVWTIWKCYLGWSFQERPDSFNPRSWARAYEDAVLKRIMRDRAMVINPATADASVLSAAGFKTMWGMAPGDVVLSRPPGFLTRDEEQSPERPPLAQLPGGNGGEGA